MVIDSIVCETSSWVLVKKEFSKYSLNEMVRDWVLCISMSNGGIIHPSLEWSPPDCAIYKVNFDGASFNNPGPAAFGCVMRDSHDLIIWVKGGPIGVSHAIHAETMGLLEGLELAKGKGVRDCILEGNSLSIISCGRGERCGSWKMHHFIVEIRSPIFELDAKLHHVPRCQNSLANKIAKWNVGQPNLFEGDHMLDHM